MRIFSESGHVREEPLELYVLGDLPEAPAEDVRRHLETCASCRRASVGIADFIRMLRLLAARIQCSESSGATGLALSR
jgi:anti-sigma factor RsiW